MEKELELILVEKYPIIFRDYKCGSPSRSLMFFGFECDDGWFDLIDDLCKNLTILSKKYNITIIATQVKEKFGWLRFYYYCESIRNKPNIISLVNQLISQYMFSKKLGRLYWFLARLRRKIYKTPFEKIETLVETAEYHSSKICERCGNPGQTKGTRWMRTMCPDCEEKFNNMAP